MKPLVPILPVSELRHKSKDVFAHLSENPVVLTLRGRPRAVLLDYDSYNDMIERQQTLEMIHDALDAFLLQRAKEEPGHYRSFDELLMQHEELFGEKMDLPSFTSEG